MLILIMDTTLLTQAQVAYLRVRPNYKSDRLAAEGLGVSYGTVKVWKSRRIQEGDREIRPFKQAYDIVMEEMNISINNPNEFVDRALVPEALKRISEIVGTEITNDTSAQKMGVIGKTAETILKTKGILAPDSVSVFRVDTVVAEMLNAGEKFTADYLPSPGETPEPKRLVASEVVEHEEVRDSLDETDLLSNQ